MKRILGALAVVPILPCLMGATINITLFGQPGGDGTDVREGGTFTLGPNETVQSVFGHVKRNQVPPLFTNALATTNQQLNPHVWTAWLSVIAGNYDAWGEQNYLDNLGFPQNLKSTVINRDVA